MTYWTPYISRESKKRTSQKESKGGREKKRRNKNTRCSNEDKQPYTKGRPLLHAKLDWPGQVRVICFSTHCLFVFKYWYFASSTFKRTIDVERARAHSLVNSG